MAPEPGNAAIQIPHAGVGEGDPRVRGEEQVGFRVLTCGSNAVTPQRTVHDPLWPKQLRDASVAVEAPL
jgi:hypothetical protein